MADNDKDLSEFKNFLGTLGRQSVPLDLVSWHKFREQRKEELWTFVKTNYKIFEEGWTYTLQTIDSLWRLHKSRIKKEDYLRYNNDEDRLKNRTNTISIDEFKALLKYWGDKYIQKAEKTIGPEQLALKDDIYAKTRK